MKLAATDSINTVILRIMVLVYDRVNRHPDQCLALGGEKKIIDILNLSCKGHKS